MNDDLTILASAYLDGDVTADERAQVEASAELLAEVDRLRTVRAIVSHASSSDNAPISMRERHLAGALDAWDRLPDSERTGALRDSTPAGADGAAAAGVAAMSSHGRRSTKRRWGQSPAWLGMAAAGLVVVLAGGLVLRNTVSDDSGDDAEVSTAESESRLADTDAGDDAPAPVADAATESELEEATAAQAPADTALLENGSDVDSDLLAEAPPADDSALEQLDTADDLAVFASDAVGAPASDDLPEGATVATDVPPDVLAEEDEGFSLKEMPLCQGADVVVGLALYGDERVVVGIDENRKLAIAYREDDCAFVARASLR
jgi:hypothetical protein